MSKIKSARPKDLIGKFIIIPAGYGGDGQVGKAIQEEYDKAGIKTNYGIGPDLPQFNKEIKSRKKDTWTHFTIGTSKISTIINTNGEVFLDKMQNWDLHIVEDQTVIKTESIDLSSMQGLFKKELAELVNQIKISIPLNGWTMAKSDFFILERTELNDDRYGKLRVKGNKFKGFKALSNSTYFNLFEEV
jgi:hypothetical protein